MTLKEVGEQLRQERLRRGLSYDEVIRKTKISRRILEALEDGRQQDLPHVVYVKGFIKTYAGMLQLDTEDMAQSLDQAYGLKEDGWIEDVLPTQQEILADLPGKSRRKAALTVVILLLCVAAAVGWFLLDSQGEDPFYLRLLPAPKAQDSHPASSESVPPAVIDLEGAAAGFDQFQENEIAKASDNLEVPQPLEGQPLSVMPDEAAPEAGASQDQAISGTDADAALEIPATDQSVDDPGANAQSASSASQAEQDQVVKDALQVVEEDTSVSGAPGSQQIRIVAKGSCWVEASDSQGNTRDVLLKPGESFHMGFEERLTVRLGNAGGVDIFFNNKPFDLGAESGQVLTVQFPPEGNT